MRKNSPKFNQMNKTAPENILVIDIGGSHVKGIIINSNLKVVYPYQKTPTPPNLKPATLMATIKTLTKNFTHFDKVAVGFPGYVKQGIVYTAPNLNDFAFRKFPLSEELAAFFNKPVRLVNDADLQGFALVKGKGFEMVITLGTGFGTALFMDGVLLPHLELAHLPVRKNYDYDDFLGDAALELEGDKKWNKKLKEVLDNFRTVFNFDHLYISGGNAKHINFALPEDISIESNRDGIKGGAVLWNAVETYSLKTIFPKSIA